MADIIRVSRDLDIGRRLKESVIVDDMNTLLARVKDTTDKLDESLGELEKIRIGVGFTVDEDLEEV